MSTSVEARTIVLNYFRLWNTGDLALAHDLLGERFVNHADSSIVDAESLQAAVTRTREDYPELHVFVDAILGGPRMVTAVGRARTKTSSGPQIWNAVWTFRLDNGIVEVWRHRDPEPEGNRVESQPIAAADGPD